MSVREYLESIGGHSHEPLQYGYRETITVYESGCEHSVDFVSSVPLVDRVTDRVDESTESFDVYFWGPIDDDSDRNCVTVSSKMRINTVDEARFIIEHLSYEISRNVLTYNL